MNIVLFAARLDRFINALAKNTSASDVHRRAVFTLICHLGYTGAVVFMAGLWCAVVGKRTNWWGKYVLAQYFSMGLFIHAKMSIPMMDEVLKDAPAFMGLDAAKKIVQDLWESTDVIDAVYGTPGSRIPDIQDFVRSH